LKKIFSVQVENRSGVLSKISGLFARRCYNIDSLAVGETEVKDVSCMTIVSSGDEQIMQQIEKQLNKTGLLELKLENGRIVVITVKRTATAKF